MLDVFLNVIMPTFLVAAAAAALQRWRKIPVGPLSQTTLYLLTPSLIFTSIVSQRMPAGTSFKIVAATLLATAFVLLLAAVLNKALRHDRPMQSAFMLSTGFPNAGNMALPILQLAFGENGLAMGVIVFMTQSIMGQSLGIFVAARSEMSGLAPLKQIFKMPAFYAVLAGLAIRAAGIELPFLAIQPIRMFAQASIPVMLVVLGFQIGAGVKLEQAGSLVSALVVRLVISAPLAYLATVALGLEGMAQGAVVIVSAMPVAVYTTILATEFKATPKFVTNVVIASTVCSVFTLTVIVTVMKYLIGG